MKRYNLLVLFLVFNALATESDERYQVILQNFSVEEQHFHSDFIPTPHDIAIVTEHKEILEKELAGYQKSWTPIVLKTIGAVFGLDTVLRGTWGMITATDAPMAIKNSYKTIYPYINYPTRPIQYVRSPLVRPFYQKIFDMYKVGSIGSKTYDLAIGSIGAASALPSAIIAGYLFKKANSYNSEIERLEKEIEIDDMIIKKLNETTLS